MGSFLSVLIAASCDVKWLASSQSIVVGANQRCTNYTQTQNLTFMPSQ